MISSNRLKNLKNKPETTYVRMFANENKTDGRLKQQPF